MQLNELLDVLTKQEMLAVDDPRRLDEILDELLGASAEDIELVPQFEDGEHQASESFRKEASVWKWNKLGAWYLDYAAHGSSHLDPSRKPQGSETICQIYADGREVYS